MKTFKYYLESIQGSKSLTLDQSESIKKKLNLDVARVTRYAVGKGKVIFYSHHGFKSEKDLTDWKKLDPNNTVGLELEVQTF